MKDFKVMALAAIILVVATSFVTATLMKQTPVQNTDSVMVDDTTSNAIAKTLEENPELIQNAIFAYLHAEDLDRIRPVLNDFDGQLAGDLEAGFTGNADGDVTIVEFLDYRCGYCRRDHKMLNEIVKADGNIKLLIKQYPVLDREGEDPLSLWSSFGAYFALKHDKFEDYHETMMAKEKPTSMDDILGVIEEIGLSREDGEAAIRGFDGVEKLQINLALGQQIGIRGTPFYIIGEDFARGAQSKDNILKMIKAARGS